MTKLRTVEDKDLIPLARYISENFPPHTSQKNWLSVFEYWWTANPAYSDQIPRGWVLEKEDGTLVGFLGNIPVTVLVNGEQKTAVAANSWFVDPSVRGILSISLFNEFRKQKNFQVFLYKSGDEPFLEFLSRYQYKEYIVPPFRKEYVYGIDTKKMTVPMIKFILFNKLHPEFQGKSELLRRFGSFLGSLVLQKSLVLKTGASDGEFVSSICTSCDDAFVSLHRAGHRNGGLDIFYDAKTLNWLFFSPNETRERLVIQCRRSGDGSLAGYAVFEIKNDPPFRGILQLMDICIENDNLQVLESLISCSIETGRQRNINLLTFWAYNEKIEDYLRSTLRTKRSVQGYRYIRFSDPAENMFDPGLISSSPIFPPQ